MDNDLESIYSAIYMLERCMLEKISDHLSRDGEKLLTVTMHSAIEDIKRAVKNIELQLKRD